LYTRLTQGIRLDVAALLFAGPAHGDASTPLTSFVTPPRWSDPATDPTREHIVCSTTTTTVVEPTTTTTTIPDDRYQVGTGTGPDEPTTTTDAPRPSPHSSG
jgi:hypothetical protein